MTTTYEIRPVGRVESTLADRRTAPKQGFEGAPDAWLVFGPEVAEAIRDLAVGAEVLVLTWLHQARRDVLAVHPRDDPRNWSAPPASRRRVSCLRSQSSVPVWTSR